MSTFKENMKLIEQEITEKVTDAINVSHHSTTKTHFYFSAFDEFFNHDIELRVDRETGFIQSFVPESRSFAKRECWTYYGDKQFVSLSK